MIDRPNLPILNLFAIYIASHKVSNRLRVGAAVSWAFWSFFSSICELGDGAV